MSNVEIQQVYVVTGGCYSDYGIVSVWLTLEEAQAAAGPPENDKDGYGLRVEVWPVGENKRTIGTFSHSGDFDATTGQPVYEHGGDDPHLGDPDTRVLCWASRNVIGIRVSSDSQERADKVYAEVRARVLAQIDMGLPPEVIAQTQYVDGRWVPTS